MFLHIGEDVVIALKDVIAVVDLKNNNNMLMHKSNKVINLAKNTPKSYIVTIDKIYISSISTATLYNNAKGKKIMELNKWQRI